MKAEKIHPHYLRVNLLPLFVSSHLLCIGKNREPTPPYQFN